MKITKFGHCCLLIEEQGLRILTDPGIFTDAQNTLESLDVLLVTHEHKDHFHIESVKCILTLNPQIKIITNSAVKDLLQNEGVLNVEVVEDQKCFEYKGVSFEGCGSKHEEIFEERGMVMNTGYIINKRMYYPGDSFFVPGKAIDILAMPVGGPWLRIKDAINFALKVNPKIAFPVHDGLFNSLGLQVSYNWPEKVLKEAGVDFVIIENNTTYEC